MSDWVPPPELMQTLPRSCRPTGSGVFVIFIMMILLSLAATPAFIAKMQINKLEILRLHGIDTTAFVYKINQAKGGQTVEYYFYLRSDFDGQIHRFSGKSPIKYDKISPTRVGDYIMIIYNPDQKQIASGNIISAIKQDNSVKSGEASRKMRGAFIISLFGSLSVFFCWLLLFYKLWQKLKLVCRGVAVRATVLSETVSYVYKRGNRVIAQYKFTDNFGTLRTGTSDDFPAESTLDATRETWLYQATRSNPTALYDPRDGSKHILYPTRYWTCLPP